jgi:hypothetical protein
LAPPAPLRKKPRISVESQRFSTLKGYATASAAAQTGNDKPILPESECKTQRTGEKCIGACPVSRRNGYAARAY